MDESENARRRDLLEKLVRFDPSMPLALGGPALDWWDPTPGGPTVVLTDEHARKVLVRFQDGTLSSKDVEAWANAIESREDIDFSNEKGNVLEELIFELANPLLTQALDSSRASSWIDRL
jgi:hypothetical protein